MKNASCILPRALSSCTDSESFFIAGPNLRCFICVFVAGREDPNTTISRPSSVRQQNAILLAFPWRADDGLTLNAGLVAL